VNTVSRDDIRLFLYKPNRDCLGEISAFLKPKHKPKLAQVNELTFTLPYYTYQEEYVDLGKPFEIMKVKNKYFDLLRERYLLKVEWIGKTEWYLIDNINKTGSSDGNYKEVTAFSLPYELRGDRVFGWAGVMVDGSYRKESLSLNQVADNILQGTLWTINHIDTDLMMKFRGFDFNDQTKLECLYEIADTFNAVIEWDTINRMISFYHEDNYGTHDGLLLSYRHYLKSIQDEVKPNDIITRLIPVGKDGIQINSKNPSGSPYLQDFSYWMQPFQRDEDGNVLEGSYWFSDGLCHALLDYNELATSKQTEFDTLLVERTDLISQRSLKQAEIDDKNSEIRQVEDIIDVKQSNNEDASTELAQLETLQNELAVLESEYDTIQANLDTNQTALNAITDLLTWENNFTASQIEELQPFINTTVWENNNLVTEEDLIEASKEYFKKVNHPKKAINIGLVDLLRIVKGKKDIKKLTVGDKLNINYEFLDVNAESQIIEMDIDYDSGSISLVIANTKDVFADDNQKMFAELYKNAQVAGAVAREKFKWDKIEYIDGAVNDILTGEWNAAKREITAGVNQSVIINERGITVVDYADPNRFVRIMNGVIGMTEDGGNTFKLALDATGVYAERLVGKAIIGERLTIGDEEGTFEIKGNLLTVKDREEVVRLLLGEYETDKFGLKLMNKSGQDVILDEDGMLQSWQEGRTDNVDSNNGLSLYVYLPSDTISVRKAILNFKLLAFRAYSQGTASGGGSTQTSSSGGGTTATSSSGGGTSKSTSNGGSVSSTTGTFFVGDSVITSTTVGNTLEGHWHRITDTRLNHSHSFSISSHSHSFSISNHSHTVTVPNHSHSVTIPNHTHGIDYGIYTSTVATGVGIIINGTDYTGVLGGLFTTDQSEVDITQYMQIGQWNEIKLTSSRLGRIDGNIFIQTFQGV
jgi:hypothetical protein